MLIRLVIVRTMDVYSTLPAERDVCTLDIFSTKVAIHSATANLFRTNLVHLWIRCIDGLAPSAVGADFEHGIFFWNFLTWLGFMKPYVLSTGRASTPFLAGSILQSALCACFEKHCSVLARTQGPVMPSSTAI